MSMALDDSVADAETTPVSISSEIVPDGYLLTTRFLRYSYPIDVDGCPTGFHAHPEHVVFWPDRGTASVTIANSHHRLSLGQGVWVPAGTPHKVDRSRTTPLAALHITTSAWDGQVDGVRAVTVGAALRELLAHLDVTGMPKQQRLRAQQVCLELIADETAPAIELPIPRDERISAIAAAIRRDPADDRSLEDWAWAVSLSPRTIARAFTSETGMTFTQWRTAARMSAAVRLLGSGTPVGLVARQVGYSTVSSFSTAFHRVMGRPPHTYRP